MRHLCLIVLTALSISCASQAESEEILNSKTTDKHPETIASQIGEYVVEIFEDSLGNCWFGTLENGVAKFDGNELKYLTVNDGLPSNRIVSVIGDRAGILWFGTDLGLAKYDGYTFSVYTTEDGLCDNRISNLFIDSKGNFWIGTWGGVCRYDGSKFDPVPIPYPVIETKPNEETKNWITSISEDAKGNIWFGRDGYGAAKFDGKSFVHLTKKDGLYSNNVQTISEDNEGNIWIGTRVAEKDNADSDKRFGKGGLNKYDGENITHFPNIDGLNNHDVYEIYKDNAGRMWISTTNNGVYKYENNYFKNYPVPKSTMCILRDENESVWLGCAGGLYRINPKGEVFNVTTNGPWE